MDTPEHEFKDDLDKLIEALQMVLASQAPADEQARQTAKRQIQRALDRIIDQRLEHGQHMNNLRQPRS